MSANLRRVHTVRLKAPSEELVRRGATLLEDALRTASIPGGHGGRLLVFRSLAVGRIRAGRSPARLALAIEERLRDLIPIAVHAEDPEAGNRPVVYFRDEAEPFTCLALRLARQEPAGAWFWPLAVPAWRPTLPRDQALRLVLEEVLHTQAGSAAAAALIQALQTHHVLDHLLGALRWQDGPALLRASGWSAASAPRAAIAATPFDGDTLIEASVWESVLRDWTAYWGPTDARSVWLVAMTLIAQRPSRLLDPQFLRRAQQLVRQATVSKTVPPSSPEGPSATAEGPGEESPSGPFAATLPSGPPLPEPQGPTKPSHVHDLSRPEAERYLPQPSALSEMAARRPSHVAHSEAKSYLPQHSVREQERAESHGQRAHWSEEGQPTRYAGLFFLVPALARLGIASWLEASVQATRFDFLNRLLDEVARFLAIPTEDAVRAAWRPVVPEQEIVPWPFTMPASWQELCRQRAWVVRRLEGTSGVRLLSDRSGRLVVALWHGKAPAEVRALARGRPLRRGPARAPATGGAVLLDTWLTALRRWCRRYARLSLTELTCRPGRVRVTPTHLDVLFNHQQTDVRIRKAGLDLDPGWVPCFGRVVQFHYSYGG